MVVNTDCGYIDVIIIWNSVAHLIARQGAMKDSCHESLVRAFNIWNDLQWRIVVAKVKTAHGVVLWIYPDSGAVPAQDDV